MPAIFPKLQPEELLYSGIARYGDMMGFQSALALWRSIYGEGLPYPEVDLCGPLKSLLSRMPKGFPHDTSSLLRKHTLYPYHTFSMLPKRRRRIEERLSSDRPRPKGGLLRTGAGLVKPPTYLQYCRACAETDRRGRSGIRYWRRSHQLPGVVVCPEHGERLIATNALRPKTPYSREIVSLEQALHQGKGNELKVPSSMIGAASRVAADSLWLLKNADLGNGDLLRRHKGWQRRCGWQYRKGRNTGNTKVNALSKAVKEFYPKEFLQTLCEGNKSLIITKNGGWIRRMSVLSREHVARPPLQHILLWQFLGINAKEFFEESEEPNVLNTSKDEGTRNGKDSRDKRNTINEEKENEERLKRYRRKWLKISKKFPKDGRTELRNRRESVAHYLSMYDKKWYSENSPTKDMKRKIKRKENYKKIDKKTIDESKKAVREMKREDPPVQISMYGISVRIGQSRKLPYRLSKNYLPITKKYIDGVTETRKEFAERRLDLAVERFLKDNNMPTFTLFTKTARVKPEAYSGLSRVAYKLLKKKLEERKTYASEMEALKP